MKSALYDLLSNDDTLMATLTGGLYKDVEISRQGTPDAFDANGEIEPCGLLKMETQTPFGPHDHSARLFFSLLLYQRSGYGSTQAARERAYALLHRGRVSPAAGGCWQIFHADEVLNAEDDGLGCSLETSRFYAVVGRS